MEGQASSPDSPGQWLNSSKAFSLLFDAAEVANCLVSTDLRFVRVNWEWSDGYDNVSLGCAPMPEACGQIILRGGEVIFCAEDRHHPDARKGSFLTSKISLRLSRNVVLSEPIFHCC